MITRTIIKSNVVIKPSELKLILSKLQKRRRYAYNCVMSSFRTAAFLSILTCVAILGSCTNDDSTTANSKSPAANQPSEKSNAAKTNVEELAVLVNIPYEAEDIVWKDDPNSKKLTAILRFSTADSAKLVIEAERIRPPQQVNLPTESWFPAELIAQSDLSGDDTLNGKSYAATNFLLEPYVNGSITRIENTDYFVLEASK